MNTTPKLMTRTERENQWGLYLAAMGEIPPERLRELAWSDVPSLEDEIRQMDDVFDFEKYTVHAIAFEIRHAALLQVVSLERQEVPA